MPSFRKLSDSELDALSDEQLIDYVRRAREAGEPEAMQRAIQILAFAHYDLVVDRVRLKMERQSDADAEAVIDAVMWGAMVAAFRGESIGEFRALLSRIIQRRVADHYRSLPEGALPDAPLPSEHEGDEGVWGEVPRAPEMLSGVWARELLERALSELTALHRAVVERRLEGYSSKEAAELVNDRPPDDLASPMTPQNVDQINSRFRRRLRDLISEADRSGNPDKPEEEDD